MRCSRWAVIYFYLFYFVIVIVTTSLLVHSPSAPPFASNANVLSYQISFVMDAFFLHFKNGIAGEQAHRPVLSKRKQLDYELAFSIMCVGSFAICFPATLLRAKSRAWTCRCCIEHSKGDKGLLNGQHVSAHLFLYN